MSFTNQNIAAFETALKQGMGALLTLQQVLPYPGDGDPVDVMLTVTTKRANESDLTGGTVQDTNLVATIDADDWDAKVGREPQQGDVIWWLGKRHAVERSVARAPAGNKIFYSARLQG